MPYLAPMRIYLFILFLFNARLALGQVVDVNNLIPQPQRWQAATGTFLLDGTVALEIKGGEEESNYFATELYRRAGISASRRPAAGARKVIFRQLTDTTDSLGLEGYRISITPDVLTLEAPTGAGLLNGTTTLVQMAALSPKAGQAKLPCGVIIDQPRFAWRGMHLDVSRHFFTVDEVKRYLDMMVAFKLNTFHWHLTDDQGWRLEIARYPKLTTIGSRRARTMLGHGRNPNPNFDSKPIAGFYTRRQVADVVRYARQRHITIVPEIEMPGHVQAVLAAYPELGCTNQKLEVWEKWGVSRNILNPSDSSIQFMKNVLNEVVEMFPDSPYIHLGGDEAVKDQWKANPEVQARIKQLGLKDEEALQGWFLGEMEKHLQSLDRKALGWDEVRKMGLKSTFGIMAWRGPDQAAYAARDGYKVVMAAQSHLYFDKYPLDPKLHPDQPMAIGGLSTLENVLSLNPVAPELTAAQAPNIVGVQACLWTEYIATFDHLTQMALPRALALAEVGWHGPGAPYPAFKARVVKWKPILTKWGYKVGAF